MVSVPYTPTSNPTDGERAQLYRYHVANIFLNQHQWYEACKYLTLLDINAKLIFIRLERSFNRSINQSTASHILRKFNEDPHLPPPAETTQKSTKRKQQSHLEKWLRSE